MSVIPKSTVEKPSIHFVTRLNLDALLCDFEQDLKVALARAEQLRRELAKAEWSLSGECADDGVST